MLWWVNPKPWTPLIHLNPLHVMRASDRIQYKNKGKKIAYKHKNNIKKVTTREGVIPEMSKIALTSVGLSFLICNMVSVWGGKKKN